MAWSAPTTRSDGYVVPASEWNKNTVDNPNALRTGEIAIASQAVNEIIFASSASQFARNSGFTFDGTTFTMPGQIKFPASQSASSNANTLDDYEEGTFTPVIGGSGGTSGQTYTIQVGRYVKIGKLVALWFKVAASNKGTITTNAQIQGLPFTSENTTNQDATCSISIFDTGAGGTPLVTCSGVLAPNTTAINLFGAGAAVVTPVNLTTAAFDTAIGFTGLVVYTATA